MSAFNLDDGIVDPSDEFWNDPSFLVYSASPVDKCDTHNSVGVPARTPPDVVHADSVITQSIQMPMRMCSSATSRSASSSQSSSPPSSPALSTVRTRALFSLPRVAPRRSMRPDDDTASVAHRVPLCTKHGLPTVRLTVRKQSKNRGRMFWVCSVPVGDKCHFFAWDNELATRRGIRFQAQAQAQAQTSIEHGGIEQYISLEMLTMHSVLVLQTPFSQSLTNVITTAAPSASYEVQHNGWSIALVDYDAVVAAIRRSLRSGNVKIDGIPDFIVQRFRKEARRMTCIEAKRQELSMSYVRREPHSSDRDDVNKKSKVRKRRRRRARHIDSDESESSDEDSSVGSTSTRQCSESVSAFFGACQHMPARLPNSVPPPNAHIVSTNLRAIRNIAASSKCVRHGRWHRIEREMEEHALMSEQQREAAILRHLPRKMWDKLYEFQKEGLMFVAGRAGRAFIADEMGLGKTIQAIGFIAMYRRDWPALVVCPSSLRFNWQEEICEWLSFVRMNDVEVITSSKNRKRPLGEAAITVISYDLMVRMSEELTRVGFNCIVLDESHYIKSGQAKRTRVVLKLTKKARRLLLLSGTPALNRPDELYTQMTAIDPRLFSSKQKFGLRYCDAKRGPYGWDFKGNSHLRELNLLLTTFIMIRRLKQQVLSELPAKRRQKIMIQVSSTKSCKQAMKKLGGVSKSIEALMDPQGSTLGSSQREAIMAMYVESSSAKIKGVVEYVAEQCLNGKKFLVFAHHLAMLDAVNKRLRKMNVRYIRIDGSTPPHVRQEHVEEFQTELECQVALLSLTAGGTGLTLHAAAFVVFAELYWTPGILIQAEDRVHRIGQQRGVSIHYLLGRGTIDDILWPLISKKLEVLAEALNPNEGDTLADSEFGDTQEQLQRGQTTLPLYFSSRRRTLQEKADRAAPAMSSCLRTHLGTNDGSVARMNLAIIRTDLPRATKVPTLTAVRHACPPPPKRKRLSAVSPAKKQQTIEYFMRTKSSSAVAEQTSRRDTMQPHNTNQAARDFMSMYDDYF